MCGICNVVNCVRRAFCGNRTGYGRYNRCENTYSYRGCDDDCGYTYNRNNGCGCSRYSEPRTRITCANQRDNGFTPCCDESNCCHDHCHDHCDDDCDC